MMLRLTLERVGAGGRTKTIGRGVIGRWAGSHLAAIADDRTGHRVGKVQTHDPDDGPWSLVTAAIAACLDGDTNLTDQQRRTLEHAIAAADRRVTADVGRAIDLLSRAARTMAINSVEAGRAGLEGDARRWRVVRGDVVAALEQLGAVPEADERQGG